jgi:hypothetical protein
MVLSTADVWMLWLIRHSRWSSGASALTVTSHCGANLERDVDAHGRSQYQDALPDGLLESGQFHRQFMCRPAFGQRVIAGFGADRSYFNVVWVLVADITPGMTAFVASATVPVIVPRSV